MRILWPVCVQHAEDLDHAKAAFYLHVSNDPAWTDHYSEQELIAFIDSLEDARFGV
jgi:hypothetical protein